MRQELARIAAALGASETLSAEQKVQIADLGKRLNAALASKVEELARYRSEFFGRLRKVLGTGRASVSRATASSSSRNSCSPAARPNWGPTARLS